MSRAFHVAMMYLVCNLAFAAPPLSDSDAKSIIEAGWGQISIRLGVFSVVNNTSADKPKGTVTQAHYTDLLNWQRVGLITVAEAKQQRNQLALESIEKKITVAATAHGRRYLSSEPDRLLIRTGTFTVTNIQKNEERKKGLDDFRLLMFTYNAEWSPEIRAFSSASGKELANKRKAMMLLKFDPFETKWKWKIIAQDWANVNDSFKTNYVEKKLSE